MADVECGLLAGKVPYIRGGAGRRQAIVFPGANALFRPLDQMSNPGRFARQIAKLLPRHRFTILGYTGGGFDRIVPKLAAVIAKPPNLLMGISLGGMVAMRFAARHPELVKRLVILVSAHRFSEGGQRILERQFQALERGDLESLVRENVLQFRRPWFNWLVRLKLWREGRKIHAGLRDPAAILDHYRQLFGPGFGDNAEHCRRIACPALVIGGTADRMFDREAYAETAALIPRARLRLFEKETHMLPIERGGAVASALGEFLEEN